MGETPYNSDFQKCCDEAKPECYGKKTRPIKAIEGLDLTKYDAVFVGSPNWWGTLAPPVRTWLTQNVAALKLREEIWHGQLPREQALAWSSCFL